MQAARRPQPSWVRGALHALFYAVWPCLLLLGFFTFPSGSSNSTPISELSYLASAA